MLTLDNHKKESELIVTDNIFDITRIKLIRESIDSLQVNLGMYCNQTCAHCHHEAGPDRTELMPAEVCAKALDFAMTHKIRTIELTGGSPELNPNFKDMVRRARRNDMKVINRCNLTVIFEDGMEGLPQFFADNDVELVCSMPCYLPDNVEAQRGSGVYNKSIEALQMLNKLGYGCEGTDLLLNLVYNPGGGFLPGDQKSLEEDYHRNLYDSYEIMFNRLYTITNMPIGRFSKKLSALNQLGEYMDLLADKANPGLVDSVMCRNLVSIGWDGTVYDCDFNQALGLPAGGISERIWETDFSELKSRSIATGTHCNACIAGTGSSCCGRLEASAS